MPDREKVIKWMENCVKGHEKAYPEDRPYFQQCFPDGKAIPFMPLMQDALSLLKEQEPVKPNVYGLNYYFCGNCDTRFRSVSTNYCPKCGRKVKWDD